MAILEDLSLGKINVNINYTKDQVEFINKNKELCGGFLPSCFEDADFLSVFMEYIDKEDWEKYVLNIKKNLVGDKDFDPKYVLMFRRTTLAENPKPEVFWTNEYGVVRNGLKKEIPEHSEYRILSKIFISTLKNLSDCEQTEEEFEEIDKKYGYGSSDGEIRISSKPFDLRERCLFAIKPESERKELEDYLAQRQIGQE